MDESMSKAGGGPVLDLNRYWILVSIQLDNTSPPLVGICIDSSTNSILLGEDPELMSTCKRQRSQSEARVEYWIEEEEPP
jgi:hypothetical protein